MQDFMLDTSHFELLRVSGADAARFLQGQLTCDVDAVPDKGACLGAVCNNKGRVITPFVLWRQGEDLLLVFRPGLAALFLAALKKYLPFYKCRMEPEQALACIGLGGASLLELAGTWSGAHLWRIEGAQNLGLACGQRSTLEQLAQDLPAAIARNGNHWQAAWLRAGHFPFAVEDSEVYTPQELHYEQCYVSFTKGCYTGQEIVARMHYRGKAKKRLYLVEFACDDAVTAGRVVLLAPDRSEWAECFKLVPAGAGACLGLAQLPLEAAELSSIDTSAGVRARLRPF